MKEILGKEIDIRIGTLGFRGVEKLPGFALRKTFVASSPSGPKTVRVFEGTLPNSRVPIYALDPDGLFDRPGLYGENGEDYPDNLMRFSVWNHALLQMLPVLDFIPDILHANDWQTALSIPLLPEVLGSFPARPLPKTLLSIHNMAYQGIFPLSQWGETGLPDSFNHFDGLEFHGSLSLLKGGIQHATALSTVSPSYRDEVLMEPGGSGLSAALKFREHDFFGLLNGIDLAEWNPETDKFLPYHYSARQPENKIRVKQFFRNVWDFPKDRSRPLFGVVSRMASQKGLDLLARALLERGSAQGMGEDWIVLGSGEPEIEKIWKEAQKAFPKEIRVIIGFDEALSHQIMAAADFLVVPSVYEPCGLTQMYAMRYGTLPVVNPTGGLRDTVIPGKTGLWLPELSTAGLASSLEEAGNLFIDRPEMDKIQRKAMEQATGWDDRASAYLRLYRKILGQKKRQAMTS